jgi:hypothetical protein
MYDTIHSKYGTVIICKCKQGHYSDRRICQMMTLMNILYNSATSNALQVSYLVLKKTHQTQTLLLRIKSIGRYIHHKELKVVCHYMEKES